MTARILGLIWLVIVSILSAKAFMLEGWVLIGSIIFDSSIMLLYWVISGLGLSILNEKI